MNYCSQQESRLQTAPPLSTVAHAYNLPKKIVQMLSESFAQRTWQLQRTQWHVATIDILQILHRGSHDNGG